MHRPLIRSGDGGGDVHSDGDGDAGGDEDCNDDDVDAAADEDGFDPLQLLQRDAWLLFAKNISVKVLLHAIMHHHQPPPPPPSPHFLICSLQVSSSQKNVSIDRNRLQLPQIIVNNQPIPFTFTPPRPRYTEDIYLGIAHCLHSNRVLLKLKLWTRPPGSACACVANGIVR